MPDPVIVVTRRWPQSVEDELQRRYPQARLNVDDVPLGPDGLRPVDGPFGDFSDPDGYRAGARRAAALGCEGKWAIHPSQVELANEVFSPPEAEVARARRIVEELRKAEAAGRGAASLDGKMIDAASERMAQTVIAMDDAIRVAASRA